MAPQRKSSPRLPGYDYRWSGFYCITICTFDRRSRFGEIHKEKMIMNAAGKIIDEAWRELPDHYANLKLDQFIVMPNHFHAIAILDGESYVLSEIVRGFKTWSSRRINKLERAVGKPVWQRSFYDHVIRDDKDLEGIREYIVNNPLKWDLDHDNPSYFQITGNVH